MRLFFTFFIISLTITASYARSGGVGNGGDGIVCGNSVILLDSYEAQKLKLEIDLNADAPNATIRSMVDVAIKRLERFDEYTATLLRHYSYEIVDDLELFERHPDARGTHTFLGATEIAPIDDSFHVSTPEGCEKSPRQLVSQRVPRFKLDYRYEINQTLWDKMTKQDQAMTVLHEAWYRIMLENGAENSIATRYINALVASKQFESYSFADYFQEIKETELNFYFVKNTSETIKDPVIEINLDDNEFHTKEDAICADKVVFNPSIKETYTILNRDQDYLKNIEFPRTCFKNSRLTEVTLPDYIVNLKHTLRLPFHQMDLGHTTDEPIIYFHTNGKLHTFSGIHFENLVEMFYVCDEKKSFTQREGCASGPFINHDSKINNPKNIVFDEDEWPIAFKHVKN